MLDMRQVTRVEGVEWGGVGRRQMNSQMFSLLLTFEWWGREDRNGEAFLPLLGWNSRRKGDHPYIEPAANTRQQKSLVASRGDHGSLYRPNPGRVAELFYPVLHKERKGTLLNEQQLFFIGTPLGSRNSPQIDPTTVPAVIYATPVVRLQDDRAPRNRPPQNRLNPAGDHLRFSAQSMLDPKSLFAIDAAEQRKVPGNGAESGCLGPLQYFLERLRTFLNSHFAVSAHQVLNICSRDHVAADCWSKPAGRCIENVVLPRHKLVADQVVRAFEQDFILSQPAQKLRAGRQ